MKFFLITMMVVSSVSTSAVADSISANQQALPKDARVFLQRYEACGHFSGEFNGDGSARDRELKHQMERLGCDTIKQDEKKFRKKYNHNKKVMAAIIAIDAPY